MIIDWFINFLLRHRLLVTILVVAATAAGLRGMCMLTYDEDPRNLLKSSQNDKMALEEMLSSFASDDRNCIIVLEAQDILAPHVIEIVYQLVARLQRTKGVRSVDSIFRPQLMQRLGNSLVPGNPIDKASSTGIDEVQREVASNPLLNGHLLSADMQTTLVIVQLDTKSADVSELEPMIRGVQSVVDESTEGSRVHARISGVPNIRSEIVRSMQRDQLKFTLLGTALAALVAALIFRRIGAVLLVIVAPIVGMIWAIGALGLVGIPVNIFINVVPSLVMVIGFTDSVHLVLEMRRRLFQNLPRPEATRAAWKTLAMPCLLTSVTTAVGFGSLGVARVDSVQVFGLACAAGIILNICAVLTIIPLLASSRLGEYIAVKAQQEKQDWMRIGSSQWVNWLSRHRWPSLFGAGVLAFLLAISATTLRPEYRLAETLPTDSPSLMVLDELDRKFGGMMFAYVLVQWPPTQGFGSHHLYQVLRGAYTANDAENGINNPLSIHTLLSSSAKDGISLEKSLARLVYDHGDIIGRFVDVRNHHTIVSAHLPDVGASILQPALDRLEGRLMELESLFSGYQIHLLGPSVSMFRNVQFMIMDLWKSLLLAAIVIFFVMTVSFRSVRLGILSILPNVFPLLCAAAFLSVWNRPLELGSVIVFTICLGIAVDDTIHVIFRFRREFRSAGDTVTALYRSLWVVGQALVITTIVLVSGYGTLLFSEIGMLRIFGLLTCIGIATALVGDLVILPVLLLCFVPSSKRL